MSSIVLAEDLEIPLDLRSLAEFRRWALSDEFPERGRIDYIDGRIEVEIYPDDIYGHGGVKSEIIRVLGNRVKTDDSGDIVTRIRMICNEANVAAQPDIMYFSDESCINGSVKLIPHASGEPGRYIGLDGGPYLIVEVASDYTAVKDAKRLPVAYFNAGVREYWLVDARGKELVFQIHRRGTSAFDPVALDEDGFQPSDVLRHRYRLIRQRDELRHWNFDLLEKPF